MKKSLFTALVLLFLCSCSLLQRSPEAPNDENVGDQDGVVEDVDGGAMPVESELSRLNTKVAALETKLEVLSANMERMQLKKNQPVIEANLPPQENMAAPVSELNQEQSTVATVSAAPARPQQLPSEMKPEKPPVASTEAEKDFSRGMELFQAGRNLEAASRFALMAKKFPRHLLAAHALYWAGEASARAQQWTLAVENWEDLENQYPHSAYVPDAMAGLAKAYEKQGNLAKAEQYRNALIKSFPQSPVALSLQSNGGQEPPLSAAPTKASASTMQDNSVDTDSVDVPNYPDHESGDTGADGVQDDSGTEGE